MPCSCAWPAQLRTLVTPVSASTITVSVRAPVLPHFRRGEPFLEDLDGALHWLRAHEYRSFVLVGSCFGAETSLLAVSERKDIRGVALVSYAVAADQHTCTESRPTANG